MNDDQMQANLLAMRTRSGSEIPEVIDIAPDQVASSALKRLLEEVQNEDARCNGQFDKYDRTYNRHNR